MSDQPHSAEHFGPQRDYWWNRDFLDLMAARWQLHEAGSLADIGCGRCHWSRLLYGYLRSPAQITGVDREPQWIAEAEAHFHRAFPAARPGSLRFVQGDATQIPLPDNSFDVVTCQTVLMHLANPVQALREMRRILRPGGLMICAEPDNFWSYVSPTSLSFSEPIEVQVRRYEFWLFYHRGKMALNEGNHRIGALLPGLMAEEKMAGISVHQSDRVPALFPPYSSPAQQVLIEEERHQFETKTGTWNREDIRRYVLAGGGTAEFFDSIFDALSVQFTQDWQAIMSGRFHSANGTMHYLVSGRKP